MDLDWKIKHFEALTNTEVYDFLRLRSEVFVVEQNCIFLDTDDYDQRCYHVLGYLNNVLVACARVVPPNTIYKEPSIGRVVTASAVRRTGLGKILMQHSIKTLFTLYGKQDIKIGAQLYLKDFYGSFGFIKTSDPYMEDGIEHIYMIKKKD